VGAISGATAIGTFEYHRQPEAECLPVRLAPRPAVLVGREALLADLDVRLAAGPRHPSARVAVLCGMGGAGKTSVAVEYAHRLLSEVGVCWQFAAEDPKVLAAEFGVLAAQLGARELVDVRDPVAAVHAVLARSQSGWLVVFDNAADLASVQAFIPPGGPGRVLVTSQSQHWPAGWAVQVPVLDPTVAARFLTAGCGDVDQGSAVELAAELDGLPLALEQAAAYMRATSTSLARYLRLFRFRQADLLARGEAAGHRDHVAATLGLALSRLGKDAPAAAGLMRLLAFLAPDPVPLGLLLAEDEPREGLGSEAAGTLGSEAARMLWPLLGDPVAAGDAVTALRRYSLAAPAGDGLIHVHRLAQAVTRAQLTDRERDQWQRAAAALVEAVIPANGQLPQAWTACALLLPHARAVLTLTSPGIWRVAQSLGYSGNYAAALDLFRVIAAAYRDGAEYGPEHPVTLSARYELAFWTGESGDSAWARDQYTALLPIRERILGPEHLHTLITRNQLARQTGEAGDVVEARDQLAVLLPIDERVLGPEHPETLTARCNLALWTGESGDAAGARDQFAALLPMRERVSGPEHPETLTARGGLAYWTGEVEDAAGARDQFAVLLPIQERVLGPAHPSTLIARRSLARWTGEAGDAAGARDQFAVLLPIQERVLGPAHPSTLIARASLARWTGRAGDAAGARDRFAVLLPLTARVLGPTHPSTLMARVSLAGSSGEAGDAAGARDQFAVLLPLAERVLGPAHPSTVIARASLAYWTREAAGLPGLYQVGWGKGGVCVRGGHPGAGDGDERDRFSRDPVPVALKRYEVVFVELGCL
jgi:Tetratricopeptide repeat